MRIGRARAFLLAAAAVVTCGVSCGKGGGGGTGTIDAGLTGPTDLVVTWTLAGKPADKSGCMIYGASQTVVNVSGTIDPALHQSTTVDCSLGTVTFSQLLVEKLGMPYVEGALLDAKGTTVVDMTAGMFAGMAASTGVDVTPTLGKTTVNLDFFAWTESSGSSSSSSTSSTTTSSSSSSGTGGTGGSATTSSSGGGTDGGASTSSSSGIMDAGDGG